MTSRSPAQPGEKIRFRANVFHDDLRRTLPGLLDEGAQHGRNIIIRPRGPGTQFIQLDDLNARSIERVETHAFLTLQTSPGNFQAWIAIPASDKDDEDFSRRLRKGAGADPIGQRRDPDAREAINFKPKHAPDFPPVQIAASSPGQLQRGSSSKRLDSLPRRRKRPPAPAFIRAQAQQVTRPGMAKLPKMP